jgi:hypothetical protein
VRAVTRVNPEQASKRCCECRSAYQTEKAAASGTGEPSRFRVSRRGNGDGTHAQSAHATREAHVAAEVAAP